MQAVIEVSHNYDMVMRIEQIILALTKAQAQPLQNILCVRIASQHLVLVGRQMAVNEAKIGVAKGEGDSHSTFVAIDSSDTSCFIRGLNVSKQMLLRLEDEHNLAGEHRKRGTSKSDKRKQVGVNEEVQTKKPA